MSSPLHHAVQVGAVADPLGALAEAMAHELLEEDPSGAMPGVAFPHPLLRAAVYRGLDPAERSRLHHLAAARSDDQHVALQHRVHAAVAPDEDLAEALIGFAAQQAEKGAWAAAASASAAAARLSTQGKVRERWLMRTAEYRLPMRCATPRRRAPRRTARGPSHPGGGFPGARPDKARTAGC
ncbi:hypothetical protein ACH4UM_18290 [Streptomyces sp. NPDC020801]|uniref:hypothetical protein n=1 Tax=unclassified Streptomyces TaxID=2593676 RepID=UPI0037882A3E